MMLRMRISLDPEVHHRARQRAARLGVSFAEYVRRVVEKDVGLRPRARGGVAAVFDLGSSGGSDVAREKDAMVAKAFSARAKPTRTSRSSIERASR
jgi:hypothetical protein